MRKIFGQLKDYGQVGAEMEPVLDQLGSGAVLDRFFFGSDVSDLLAFPCRYLSHAQGRHRPLEARLMTSPPDLERAQLERLEDAKDANNLPARRLV